MFTARIFDNGELTAEYHGNSRKTLVSHAVVQCDLSEAEEQDLLEFGEFSETEFDVTWSIFITSDARQSDSSVVC